MRSIELIELIKELKYFGIDPSKCSVGTAKWFLDSISLRISKVTVNSICNSLSCRECPFNSSRDQNAHSIMLGCVRYVMPYSGRIDERGIDYVKNLCFRMMDLCKEKGEFNSPNKTIKLPERIQE